VRRVLTVRRTADGRTVLAPLPRDEALGATGPTAGVRVCSRGIATRGNAAAGRVSDGRGTATAAGGDSSARIPAASVVA
jgi:hypothetical protein